MTREELIKHLEHLAEYVKYSEDAPALREVIEMLKCSEMPNSSEECTQERTGTHACDLIDRHAAIDALGEEPEVWTRKDEYAQGLNNQWHYDRNAILKCPPAQPDPNMIHLQKEQAYMQGYEDGQAALREELWERERERREE